MAGLAEGAEPWAIPWPCIYEFLRVVTHPRVYHPPVPLRVALEDTRRILDSPTLVLLHETPSHVDVMMQALRESDVTGNLIHDAHIAALCLERGISELITRPRLRPLPVADDPEPVRVLTRPRRRSVERCGGIPPARADIVRPPGEEEGAMIRWVRALPAMVAGLSVSLVACSDDDTTSGGNGGNQSFSNPQVFESFLRARGPAITDGIIDGLDRIVTALDGGTADGVTVTPVVGGDQVVAALDLTGDGTRESSFTATVSGSLASGATVQINQILDPSIPSLNAGVAATVTESAPTLLQVTNFSGTASQDEPGNMNASDVLYTGGTVSLDRTTGNLDGTIDCDISGEEQTLSLTTTFEPDGQGGFRVRVTGTGVDFTVP